jgi:hypothetical protein
MTDLKTRSAVLLASPEGKAMVDEGLKFSTEELQAAFAQVLAEADDDRRVVINAALQALMARKANWDDGGEHFRAEGAHRDFFQSSLVAALCSWRIPYGTLRQMARWHVPLKCGEMTWLR